MESSIGYGLSMILPDDHSGLKVSYSKSPMIVCLKNMTIELLVSVANRSFTSYDTSAKQLQDYQLEDELTFY